MEAAQGIRCHKCDTRRQLKPICRIRVDLYEMCSRCLKCGVPKAASRNVKKGEALLGVMPFDNLVSTVAHVAAQGLPGICADPTLATKSGPKQAAETPGGYTQTNIPVAIAFQDLARSNMLHFMHSTVFFIDCESSKKEHRSRTSAQGAGSEF